MSKLIKKLSGIRVFTFVIQTVIPFLAPFIFEVEDKYISPIAKGIIVCVIVVVDLFLIFQLNGQEKEQEEENFKNKILRKAYSNIYELNEKKRDFIVNRTYKKDGKELFCIPEETLPYNVHEYITDICNSFRNVVAQLTDIEKKYVSVSFIYKYIYKDDKSMKTTASNQINQDWRWVVGKEPTMLTSLNEFVEQEDTVYHTLLGKNTVVFYNDKQTEEQLGKYYMSSRDKLHNKIGSIFGIKMMFSNNAEPFVEGILIISTYGKRLVKDNNDTAKIEQLKQLIIEDLWPTYQRMLETEMGILFLRHIS